MKSTTGNQLRITNRFSNTGISSALVFLSCFFFAFILGSSMLQPQGAKAVTGLGLVAAPSLTMSADAASVSINPIPTANNGMALGSSTLTASTNVPTGYNLTLSATSNATIPPINGTIANPVALTNNTWGYALTNSGTSGAVGVTNGFDASYTVASPNPNSKWANPTAAATVKRTNASASGDTTNVYYGAKVDMNTPSGTYSNTVTYTATANITDIPTPGIISVTPSSGSTAGGTVIQIVGTGFTVNDESVTSNVRFGGPAVGGGNGVACTAVTISSNVPILGQDTIYCTMPAAPSGGSVAMRIETWGGTAYQSDVFDYLRPATISFVSPDVASTIAGSESGPAFTVVGTGFTDATSVTIGGTACSSFEVISDTHIFCKAPNTISATGDKKIEVAKSGILSQENINIAYTDTAYPTLQGSDAYANCSTTAKLYRDTRDSQLYYVKKMADEKCWMVDNLKYANYGDLSQEAGKYLTVDGTNSQSTANSNVAKYVDPGADNYCKGNTNMPTNTNTRCGLLYNWYTATNGTGTYAQSTAGTNVTGSICPANFRLPSGMSDGLTATGNGTSFAAADFPVLNASMSAGRLTAGSSSGEPVNWQPNGAWGGTLSGAWDSNLNYMGGYGFFWSSTVRSDLYVYDVFFYGYSVQPGSDDSSKYNGFPVRCVMDAPPTPPEGSNPSNITGTNPAVLDVYPTTGWAGDTVAITSNARFTNVTGVTIGGTACSAYDVVTASLIACKLPAKTAGTTNVIAVTNNGSIVTNAGTYTHMKITYFDPNTSTVSINGTTYNYYPNGFTSANCSSMTANNTVIGSTPAASLAYVRDTRNNQTYRVKKMVDGKCWMVDNLKYIDTTLTYNNGDHLNNGGTTAYNTVDESSTQSTTNSDKAFYNNPMSNSYCYGITNMPTNSLTRCGYQYNWYAATNGTGTYAQSTGGTNVTGSICPANFRLPSAMSNGSTATSNGTSYSAADFAVLNASMNAGTLATGSTSSYPTNWQPSGAWGGTFSGFWYDALVYMDGYGLFWSSTVNSATYALNLYFYSSSVNPGNSNNRKLIGFAVRCVLP